VNVSSHLLLNVAIESALNLFTKLVENNTLLTSGRTNDSR